MEANKILDADLLDIIFEGKNKEYGVFLLGAWYIYFKKMIGFKMQNLSTSTTYLY